MLRGIGQEFYHKTVTTAAVEAYIAEKTGLDLKAFFDQYLRTRELPELEYYIKNKELNYRCSNTVPGFAMPVIVVGGNKKAELKVTREWAKVKWEGGYDVAFSDDVLMKVKK